MKKNNVPYYSQVLELRKENEEQKKKISGLESEINQKNETIVLHNQVKNDYLLTN